MKRSIKLISKHLQSRDQRETWVLDHFQRLNSAGHDYKGQLSSAYGQSGFGAALKLDFDFGSVIGPFVHLETGVGLSGRRAAHSLVVIQRGPSKAWFEHHPVPIDFRLAETRSVPTARPGKVKTRRKYRKEKHAPDWTSHRPIGMALLRGVTWDVAAEASASAWAGVGNAFDPDETGIAAGAKIEAGASGVRTRLLDIHPRHYSGVYTDNLSNDVDDMFEDNLKKKAAAWLAMATIPRQAIRGFDTPIETVSHRFRNFAGILDKSLMEALDAWDTQDTVVFDRNLGGTLQTAATGLRGIGRSVKAAWKRNQLATDQLILDLTKAKADFGAFYAKELTEMLDRVDNSNQIAGNYGMTPTLSKEATKTMKAAYLRMSEGQILIDALTRAKARKAAGNAFVVSENATDSNPGFYLDINTVEGHVKGQAGTKIVLPDLLSPGKSTMEKTLRGHAPEEATDDPRRGKRARATLTLEAGGYSKRTSFRFHSYVPPRKSGDAILQSTQDTVVSYHFWNASRSAALGRTERKKSRDFIATMTYRSVIAHWMRGGAHTHTALPNGSGVSFGMSVMFERVLGYAVVLKSLPEGTPDADLHPVYEDQIKLEALLVKQLRLTRAQLRAFARAIPDWLYENLAFGDAFVLESAHAFAKPVPLDFTGTQPALSALERPKNLTGLKVYKDLAAGNGDAAMTQLQSIRLRYRIRSDADRTRNLFSLGFNPKRENFPGAKHSDTFKDIRHDLSELDYSVVKVPEDKDFILTADKKEAEDLKNMSGLQNQISFIPERVTRVGTEGIVTMFEHSFIDLHTISHQEGTVRKYSEATAEKIENRAYREFAEYLVPPVQLFSA